MISKASKKWIEGVAFLAGLVAVLLLLGALFERIAMDPNDTKAIEMMGLQDESFDVLFFGNSIPLEAINPAIVDEALGTRSYNLALGGASFISSELVLRHHLERNAKPRLVVYGVSVNRQSDGDSVRAGVMTKLSGEVLAFYDEYLASQNTSRDLVLATAQRLPAFRYRAAPERFLKFLIQGAARKATFIQGHLALKLSSPVPTTHPAHDAGICRPGLDSFVSFCEREGIALLFVECPNSPCYNESVRGREEVLEALRERLGTRHRFVDLNDRPGDYGPDDWVGLNHFNASGARKFTPRVIPLIREALETGA
jgi:hypothetical protein